MNVLYISHNVFRLSFDIMCRELYRDDIQFIINAAIHLNAIASGFHGAQLTVLKLSKGKVIFTRLFSHSQIRSKCLQERYIYLRYSLVTCVQLVI